MNRIDDVISILPKEIQKAVMKHVDYRHITEIRMRTGQPLEIHKINDRCFIDSNGQACRKDEAYYIKQKEIRETVEYASNFSVYAHEEEMKNGFITVKGGNRIGICGRTIIEKDRVKNIKNISSLNIRIARAVKDVAKPLLKYIYTDEKRIYNTLIISPAACGKTTILRDLIRLISDGSGIYEGQNVAVVDERCEIGGCELGVPGNDIGSRTDILDGCPKSEGIMMLIRTMSPKVIALDEIGGEKDEEAILRGINSGCCFISTVHAYSIEEFFAKRSLEKIIRDRVFKRLILLSDRNGPGTLEGVYDGNGEGIDG